MNLKLDGSGFRNAGGKQKLDCNLQPLYTMVMLDIARLDQRLQEIDREIERLASAIDELEEEAEALRDAKETIIQYLGGESNPSEIEGIEVPTKLSSQQKTVMRAVPFGKENALAPAQIIEKCRALDASYVRTTLWRFAQAGRVNNQDGRYWRDEKQP